MPSVINLPNRYLVVSGFINTGSGGTTIRLSRTQNLSDDSAPTPEAGALVQLEEEGGRTIFRLNEVAAGTYYLGPSDFNPALQYRLRIRTQNKEYASEFVPVQVTPPIDSVSWKVQDNGLQLYVNTHDPKNSTRYYRWEYDDTWEFNAEYFSALLYRNGAVVARTPAEETYICWSSGRSTNIKIGNSIKLSQDVIREMPLLWLPSNSVKISRKYSMLVRQYALTREAFEYWDILKRNTESIGTLFDPLPSKLAGNITCLTDPAEPVIGYIGASTVTEKRIFVSRTQLPVTWRRQYSDCLIDTVLIPDISTAFGVEGSVPIAEMYSDSGFLLGYLASLQRCVDCTMTGSKVKPPFWQ